MNFAIGLLIGLFVGSFIGMTSFALFTVNKEDREDIENEE